MRPPKQEQKEAMAAEGYVPIPEAARRLGLARSSLYAAVRDGKVQTASIGPRKYLEVASLLEFAGPLGRKLWEATEPGRETEPPEEDE